MISEHEWNRMIDGKIYAPWKVGGDSWAKVHVAQKKFNESEFWHDKSALRELKKCFGKAPDDMVLTPPVYFDHGNRTYFGEHFYANTGLTILDENYVRFGGNVYLAPHVSIYTAGHPIAAEVRNTDLEYAKPVTIGSDVWIGGNVVINPGVNIGDDVVIGSGSVVTKDIPSHVIAAGNPCRVKHTSLCRCCRESLPGNPSHHGGGPDVLEAAGAGVYGGERGSGPGAVTSCGSRLSS